MESVGKHGQSLSGPDLQVRLHGAWNDPERLGALVLSALRAADPESGPDVLWAAERVFQTDDDYHRGVVVYTSALRDRAEYRKAEKLLRTHLKRHGANADVWFGLAPLAARRGDDRGVRTALDNALRHDPDHADALAWGYEYVLGGVGGSAAEDWLDDRSAHSWRGALMLADLALARGELNTAEDLYAHACGLAPRNSEMLMGCARSLTGRGYPQESANLVLRVWKASMGPQPMVHAVEALLDAGVAGQAAMAMTRLRGLHLDDRDLRVAEDLGERVRAACAAVGI